MPSYDYRCLKCGHTFTIRQKMSDPPLEHCVQCKGQVRRVISGKTGIIFKGSGFYLTDYVRKSQTEPSDKPVPTKTDEKKTTEKIDKTDQKKSIATHAKS